MDMGIDPWFLLHIQKCFYICILTVCHHTNKYISFDDFSGIRINDCCRITCPVNFHLFTGLAVDMHGSTSFLLILLNVIAELGIHEWFITISTAVFHVFCPQELFSNSVTEQLFTDVIIVWHPFSGCSLLYRREKLFCKDSIGVVFIKRPENTQFFCPL